LAAATIRTASGNRVRPTTRSNATVSIAACTDAEHVVISSISRYPPLASMSVLAQSGNANVCTAPSATTGHPAISTGSRCDPINVSTGT
jgi:hypothetical protein